MTEVTTNLQINSTVPELIAVEIQKIYDEFKLRTKFICEINNISFKEVN